MATELFAGSGGMKKKRRYICPECGSDVKWHQNITAWVCDECVCPEYLLPEFKDSGTAYYEGELDELGSYIVVDPEQVRLITDDFIPSCEQTNRG